MLSYGEIECLRYNLHATMYSYNSIFPKMVMNAV
jgi:hypothetical protein